MTYQDIYTKFMIEYDKANVTSSYPMLTEFEVATILDRAYLALIWQKVSGNNTRRVPFEYDQKAISDIQPLIRTVKHNLTVPTTRIASNVVATNLPADCLSFIDLVLELNKSDYPLDELHLRNVPTTLIPHNTVENFLVTPYNMPWIKKPVCFLENNTVNIAYDTISLGNLGSNDKALITYIKQPISFVKSLVNYVPTDEDYQNLLTLEDAYELFVRKWQDVYTGDGPSEVVPQDPSDNQGGQTEPTNPGGNDDPSGNRPTYPQWNLSEDDVKLITTDPYQIQILDGDGLLFLYSIESGDADAITLSESGLVTPKGDKNGTVIVSVKSIAADLTYSLLRNVTIHVRLMNLLQDPEITISSGTYIIEQNNPIRILITNPHNIPINYSLGDAYDGPDYNLLDHTIASIDDNLVVTPLENGWLDIIIETEETDKYFSKDPTKVRIIIQIDDWSQPQENPSLPLLQLDELVEYVDMGLPSGTKWAKKNLNYISEMLLPSEHIKGYFGFGDPTGEVMSASNSAYEVYNAGGYLGYLKELDIAGTEYDICTSKLGPGWRLPTAEQFIELSDNCTWEFINYPNRNYESDSKGILYPCWKATSNVNGNVLYFPAAGMYNPSNNSYKLVGEYCWYWTSKLLGYGSAQYVGIIGGVNQGSLYGGDYFFHLPIRPVYIN